MRSGAHRLTGVGGVPGEVKSVPSPSRRTTCCPTEVTVTEPRATNTPKRLLLGPAKNRVPRTAIRAKGYVFDRADSLNCMRRFKGKNEWERQRSVTEKPAPIAGTAAFDLAKSDHVDPVSLVFHGAIAVIVADVTEAFCHLVHRAERVEPPRNVPRCCRQAQ